MTIVVMVKGEVNMKLLERFARKHFNKWDGILTFYTVYNPNKEEKNVISHMIHPDIMKDEELNELLKQVADRIRLFYENNPELLDEVGVKSR